ncbi:hypothetical protein RRG08_030223 [Elysia crispata]|uniref:Uncharacterized protein n=1 Tax=Elysia crispata TaxID=231223 RepID=A0AAE1DZJ7_9GAST|nr:hypothetical protein RRG08_030223 [Elysia crispata]
MVPNLLTKPGSFVFIRVLFVFILSTFDCAALVNVSIASSGRSKTVILEMQSAGFIFNKSQDGLSASTAQDMNLTAGTVTAYPEEETQSKGMPNDTSEFNTKEEEDIHQTEGDPWGHLDEQDDEIGVNRTKLPSITNSPSSKIGIIFGVLLTAALCLVSYSVYKECYIPWRKRASGQPLNQVDYTFD